MIEGGGAYAPLATLVAPLAPTLGDCLLFFFIKVTRHILIFTFLNSYCKLYKCVPKACAQMCPPTCLFAQWRSKGGHAPWGAGFGGAPAHFLQALKNMFLAEI